MLPCIQVLLSLYPRSEEDSAVCIKEPVLAQFNTLSKASIKLTIDTNIPLMLTKSQISQEDHRKL
jgi:hypothetical protein